MKKKLLALFLALVMVGAVLPGCGDGSKDPGGQGNNGKTGEPVKGGEITGNVGATAGAILLQGGSATKPSSCTLENGRIFGNTATAGAEYQIYAHGSLILANQSMVESEILLMNSTARLPVLVTSALKQPLRLKLEAQVYMNKIVSGSGYTLTEADLANIELTEPLDSHYKLSVDTETNTVFLNASRVVGTVVYLAATGSDANDG